MVIAGGGDDGQALLVGHVEVGCFFAQAWSMEAQKVSAGCRANLDQSEAVPTSEAVRHQLFCLLKGPVGCHWLGLAISQK